MTFLCFTDFSSDWWSVIINTSSEFFVQVFFSSKFLFSSFLYFLFVGILISFIHHFLSLLSIFIMVILNSLSGNSYKYFSFDSVSGDFFSCDWAVFCCFFMFLYKFLLGYAHLTKQPPLLYLLTLYSERPLSVIPARDSGSLSNIFCEYIFSELINSLF